MRYNLTIKRLYKLINYGVVRKPPKEKGSVKGAFNNGAYIGAPGKDIFFLLSDMTDEDMDKIADRLSDRWSKVPPGNHVGYAACIRYIYGQFEKQGIMRSKNDFNRMKKERLDWALPRKFLKYLKDHFVRKENYYGLSILCEMEGHRLGDEIFLYNDISKVELMEEMYLKSVEYAHKCQSYKQMFTPYYWAAKYFIKMKSKDKAIEFSILCLKNAEKYCPDSRKSYIDKLLDCAKYLRKNDKKWKKRSKKLLKTHKNIVIKKMFDRL